MSARRAISLPVPPQGFQAGSQPLNFGVESGNLPHRRVVLAIPVQKGKMLGGAQKALVLVLPVKVHQVLAQFPEIGQGSEP